MNSSFINRLVGTSIVVIAAIVFIPNILDGEKVHYKEGFKAIPERPEFKTIDLQDAVEQKMDQAKPLKEDVVQEVTPDDEVYEQHNAVNESDYAQETKVVEADVSPQAATPVKSAETVKKESKTISTRQSDENLTDMAYVIQLGSFSHAANVKALQKTLTANGFKTFTKPVKTPNGTLTKVFVGPSLDKSELQRKLPELKTLTKLNGKITQYSVTN